MARELNVYIDNESKQVKEITKILSDKSVNIRAFTIRDQNDFGLIKLIVDNPDEAYSVINENGFACSIKEILAIGMKDKPGGLNEILGIFADHGISIMDSYAFVLESGKSAVLCVEVEDVTEVQKVFEKKRYSILSDNDLHDI